MDTNRKSATEIAEGVRRRESTAESVVAEALARIRAHNGTLNAFVRLDETGAMLAAREVDRRLARNEPVGPLAGVPFGVKDNEDCLGLTTSRGSLFFKNDSPATRDSISVARLRAAGAVPLGKTAAAEFGLDGVTHTKAWGTTRNPWNHARTPSGSSGGSAAAVAAGLVPFCTCSDGGGSTRVPAAFTGLVGFKPTLGRIPRANGASDVNSPGALTMTVADTARYLDIVSGADDHDRMSLPKSSVNYESAIDGAKVDGLTAVWSSNLGFAPIELEVERLARAAAERLAEAAGLRLIERKVLFTNTNMDWARLAGHRLRVRLDKDGFLPARLEDLSAGPRFLIETFGRSTELELLSATDRIHRLEWEVAEFFEQADFLLTPTAACVAYAAEGPLPHMIASQDASKTGGEPFTILANACWNPSISIPAGLNSEQLPAGLMITGRRHRDELVLRLARIAELAFPWPRVAPAYL